jgi:helicase
MFVPPNPDDQAWFPPQADLLRAGFLQSDSHWIICAPTGSGKTQMAEWALLDSIRRRQIGVYLAPLKAIVEERLGDWTTKFPDLSIGLFTGDRNASMKNKKPSDSDLLLITPEKLSSFLHNWKTHLPWLARIGVLVVDELHLLGDSSRGSNLECMLTRFRRINPFVRIIGLSGTLANAEEISDWLDARLFISEWRPIPVEHRIVRFSKVSEKKDLLRSELESTIADGGRALVFTNSRKRSEALCKELLNAGFRTAFTHAGLNPDKRQSAQQQLKEGQVDVLVTTSSLEMGVNFPARKVIIHDSYGFDGEKFGPLPVSRYLQAAGRAGRAGLDIKGESVLFLPKWAGSNPDYASRCPEPIRSGLFEKRKRTFEVLVDVSGRLSISEEHLSVNFAKRSLWNRQGGGSDFQGLVADLIAQGLLRRDSKTEAYLSETALGRIACQMVVEPATICLFVRFYELLPVPTEFDLLLAACIASECTPKLGFNFEEIDAIAETLLLVPSELLDRHITQLEKIQGFSNRRSILSAIKSAIILHRHIQGEPLDQLAEAFDAYPYDLQLLKQNLNWILSVADRVFGYLFSKQIDGEEAAEEGPKPTSPHRKLCGDLALMVEYGIPRSSVELAMIPGIGPKRAHSLIDGGISSLARLQSCTEETVGRILGLKGKTLTKIIQASQSIFLESISEDPFALDPAPIAGNTKPPVVLNWPKGIDPYRLRRALELQCDHASDDCVRVSGGAEPHRITIQTDFKTKSRTYFCDCADFGKGHSQCKHVLRARLELRDDADLMPLLRDLALGSGDKPLRYSVGEIWMGVSELYDRYKERECDYNGQRFLRKATANRCR